MIQHLRLAVAFMLLLSTSPILLAQCPSGDVILNSQADVDLFVTTYPSCTSVSGDLYIGASTSSDINDLSGLMLQTIAGIATIENNPLLTSLAGLGGITSINGRLDITNNDGLTDIDIFNNIFVGLHITVSGNDGLTTISGLNNVSSMRRLSIFNNSQLTSITGLANLDLFLDLTILNNPLLTDISGFSYIDLGGFSLMNNGTLSICNTAAVCGLVTDGIIPANISDNAAGCDSEAEIFASCLSGLPVELASFTLMQEGLGHRLFWTTASERDNLGFSIEHSLDGNQWRSLGFVNGQGTSDERVDYNFANLEAGVGLHYYRLQQINLDGSFSHSEVLQDILRISDKESNIKAYPNPSAGVLNLVITNPNNKKGNLTVTSIDGQKLFYVDFAAEDIQDSYVKRFEDLANGLYVIKLQLGQSVTWEKVQVISN